ncbi:hypothetical protein CEQ21_02170 [Niallia circulans]|uniref:Uncharacterized protein n=1 Tax=Niallia circulans TaxID=1397 RepID=A0A553SS08_NIACI|nr:hypothetical protein [Niallia circulans]TRZ39774.1 hypothetical protein CEQ21_02170 [Niallia circulans]
MKKSRFFLIVLFIISLSSLIFINKQDLKRFLPAAFFIGIVTKCTNIFAKKRRWWAFYQSIHPKVAGEDTWAWGPFFALTIWVLKWTYGKLPLYILVNLMIHFLFIYFVLPLLKRMGIFSLVRITGKQYFLVYLFREVLLYSFQSIMEYISRKKLTKGMGS